LDQAVQLALVDRRDAQRRQAVARGLQRAPDGLATQGCAVSAGLKRERLRRLGVPVVVLGLFAREGRKGRAEGGEVGEIVARQGGPGRHPCSRREQTLGGRVQLLAVANRGPPFALGGLASEV